MAKRFHSYFTNFRNVRFDIEVWDADFSGASTLFETAEGGFVLSYSGDSQRRTGVLLGTDCEVVMLVQNATHEALIADIGASKEGRFTLRVTTGVGSPTLYWAGLILADVGRYEERYYPIPFSIRATDGLGALKDVEYKDGADFYAGKESVKGHLINALSRLGYVAAHYGTGQTFLKVAVDWWEETMTNNTTNDPLALSYVDHAAFHVYRKGVKSALTCLEVVENLLRVFGARITNHDGGFWVEQITYRTAATIVIRSYDKDGVYISSNNYSTVNSITQAAAGALGAVGSYEFFGALSKVVHVFDADLRTNFLDGVVMSSSSSLQTVWRPIHANGGATTMRLTGALSLTIVNVSFSGNLAQPRHAIFECYLKAGSNYLSSTYSIQNYQVILGPATWEASLSKFYMAVWMPSGIPPVLDVTYTTLVDIWMPALPTSADNFDVDIDLIAISGGVSLAQVSTSFVLGEPRLEVYSYGSPALSDDEWEYGATNSDAGNTLLEESRSIIGNSTDPNAMGALWVKPAATYVLAGDWGDGTDTPSVRLEILLASLIMGGQLTPVRRLSGTLRGTIAPLARTEWDGAVWILLGGSWNAGRGELTGEWFELTYGSGLSTSGPIKSKIKKVGNPVPPIDGGGTSSGLQPFKLQMTPPGTLFYAVAATRTLDVLPKGAVTTVDIVDLLAAGDFYDGDTIVIMNPVTGAFDELEVTVTSAGGDDFITVTGTLSEDYPPESPIIKKPLIGHPQVFGTGTANRLAYWVSESELAEMAAGTDGWPLVSNGASLAAFEQLATGGVADDAVTFAKMQNIGSGKLLGRFSASTGNVEEITISTGLSLDGSGNLTATTGGGGTVTSVALDMPTGIFDVAGSPITTSGTLAVTLDNQSANTVFAGPTSGGAATPAFRALVASDIPAVNASAVTGLTANQVLYGSGGGGIAQSANFTFDGTDSVLYGVLTANNQNTNKVRIGSASGFAQYPGIWFGSATPSISNYAFLADVGASQTILNAPSGGNVSLRVNNSQVARITSTGMALSTGSPVNKLDVSGAAVIGATYAGTNTAPTNGLLVQGAVAIGATSAAQTLHVAGTMRLTGSDGTATTIMGRDADGDVSAITVSTGLNLSGNVLTATVGTNYQTLRDDGSAMTQRAAANFVSNSDISFALTDDAGNGETEIAASIVTNAVTDAKLRQSAGLSVVGRSANSTGNVADITAASDFEVLRRSGTSIGFGSVNLASTNAVTGTLPVANGGTGATTLANNSVLTGNGTSAIVAEANLLFNGTQLQVGTGTPVALLNVFAGAVGTTEFIRMSANVSGNMIMSHLNANNATTAANSIYQISVGGGSAGDPLIQFTVSGVVTSAIGVDNSDADKFKITPGATVPGGTANRGLVVTNAATALVGVNTDNPAQPLDVSGRARANLFCQVQANPSVAFGGGAGTGASGSCTGGANSFQIVFTTGTSPTTNGNVFTVTLPTAFPAVLHFAWSPRNAQAATDLNKFYASGFSASQLTVTANGTLAASTQYIFYFVGCGY